MLEYFATLLSIGTFVYISYRQVQQLQFVISYVEENKTESFETNKAFTSNVCRSYDGVQNIRIGQCLEEINLLKRRLDAMEKQWEEGENFKQVKFERF